MPSVHQKSSLANSLLQSNKALLDKVTCWKLFHGVFAPEVRRRTGRHVLLIMDNAPGHFEHPKVFFPPNCAKKQPSDHRIIVI